MNRIQTCQGCGHVEVRRRQGGSRQRRERIVSHGIRAAFEQATKTAKPTKKAKGATAKVRRQEEALGINH